MGNPAVELADLLEEDAVLPPGSSIYNARVGEPYDSDFWRAQARVVALVQQIDDVLTGLASSGRSVDHYLRWLPQWYRGVFAPDKNWKESGPNAYRVIDQSAIDILRSLADVIDGATARMRISPEQSSQVTSGLDEIFEILKSGELGLSNAEAQYLFELTAALRRALEEKDALGTIDLGRRINEIFGALTIISESLGDSDEAHATRNRIKNALSKIVPFARGGSVIMLGVLDAAANYSQLTS